MPESSASPRAVITYRSASRHSVHSPLLAEPSACSPIPLVVVVVDGLRGSVLVHLRENLYLSKDQFTNDVLQTDTDQLLVASCP